MTTVAEAQLVAGSAHFGGGTDGLLPATEQWPAVLEAAYAKNAALGQRNHSDDPDTLAARGYKLIGNKGL